MSLEDLLRGAVTDLLPPHRLGLSLGKDTSVETGWSLAIKFYFRKHFHKRNDYDGWASQ